MKKTLLLTAVLLPLTAGAATAQGPGTNLSWNDCTASLGTNLNMTSSCTSNTEETKNLYGTFVLPAGGGQAVNGNEIVLDAQTAGTSLPCWWNMTVSPRDAGFGMNTTVCRDAGAVGIYDYWSTIAGGPQSGMRAGIGQFCGGDCPPYCGGCPPQRVRFTMVVAIDPNLATAVPEYTETYSFTFQLKFGATVGTCTGCETPACFLLAFIRVTQTNLPYFEFRGPSARNWVTWQGGAIAAPGCPNAVPTANKTWGSVKALYR
ncbi:MAG: hypothetical protein E6K81_07585 [Candidatus Eisenbacteria bacterium]|uniref:Uncharacterized protein n=1 Tax=Eiseniibacteriota bacterium TaxID=2212470 RepID=A0A538U968_UNCEI|nr:MAG: hypothetical protein E6K81_07585 [Candidatus Eisenbacteria bacterium]